MRNHVSLFFIAAIGVCSTFAAAAVSVDVRLKYIGRYDHIQDGPDHLMAVEPVGENYALVGSNIALALVDLNALPSEGTQVYIDRLTDIDVFTVHTREDGYCFVNLRQGGFAVVYVDTDAGTLTHLGTTSEPGVYYEKMAVVGDRLYVTAHKYGIRIFDITAPTNPTLVGQLTEGFDDAWAITVAGATAYVADGTGGLKIVDIADETSPVIIAGETPETSEGTSEDVLIIGDHVYVAAGGVGVAIYDLGDISPRTIHATPGCAVHIAKIGNYLAAADTSGVHVMSIEPDGSLISVADERAQRRKQGIDLDLRLWHGVNAWGDNRVLTADWDSMDVFEVVDPATDDQPDITASFQRIRFRPEGGSETIQLTNHGSGPLTISSIESNKPIFIVDDAPGVLEPGQTMDVQIDYIGGTPSEGIISVWSDDPDEEELPILVFGDTMHLDPGEPAAPFTLESWTYDHEAGEFIYDTFDLEEHAGKVIYLRPFGTW